jgi:hypothetical protein
MKIIQTLNKWQELFTYIEQHLDQIVIKMLSGGGFALRPSNNILGPSLEIQKFGDCYYIAKLCGSGSPTREEIMTPQLDDFFKLLRSECASRQQAGNMTFEKMLKGFLDPPEDNDA